jgi:Rps23 Pro-64 3,4-dihydroxylase Tpa1-like proline 4-hydroxylase
MENSSSVDFSNSVSQEVPFPHFCTTSIFKRGLEKKLFDWLQDNENWSLTETEFYEQYEFSLLDVTLPEEIHGLVDPATIGEIESKFKATFNIKSFTLIGLTAHLKLTDGQRIGVHNDFINGDETHRLVVNINPIWSDENGGYLMLFTSSNSNDVSKIIKPLNNSGFGFEISKDSHHAISKIHDFTRYSLVYTFREEV